MRRTSLMVLVPAVLFTTALASQILLAQDTATPSPTRTHSAKSAKHTHKKAIQHSSLRPSSHGPARSAGCPAVAPVHHKTSHAAAAKHQAPGKPHLRQRAQVRLPDAIRAPAHEPSPPVMESQPERDIPPPAGKPVAKPASLGRKRIVMLPPMRGSLTSLERQNEKADAEGLERIEDEEDLSDRIARRFLVPVPVSAALTVNQELPEHHRYCRPWTARFLSDLAHAHAAQFHDPIDVSSAVRTVAYQKRLIVVNGNAAAAEGDIVSPHLTGATIDIAKKEMSRQEIGWMRYWLTPLQAAGKIDVEEEFQQACFHITVYKSYAPPRPASSTLRAKPGQSKTGQPAPGQQKPAPAKPLHTARDIASAVPGLGR